MMLVPSLRLLKLLSNRRHKDIVDGDIVASASFQPQYSIFCLKNEWIQKLKEIGNYGSSSFSKAALLECNNLEYYVISRFNRIET